MLHMLMCYGLPKVFMGLVFSSMNWTVIFFPLKDHCVYGCDLKWPIIQHKTIACKEHSELQMFGLRGSVVKCLPNIHKDLVIKKQANTTLRI